MYPQYSEERANSASTLLFGMAEKHTFIVFFSPVRLFFTRISQCALKTGNAEPFSRIIFPAKSLPFSAVGGKTAFCESEIHDEAGKLIASGHSVMYFTGGDLL